MQIPRIGGHVSAAGGLDNAFAHAERIGASTIQIFGASPRQWFVRIPSDETVRAFRKAWERSNVQSVYLHAAYLVNLVSPDAAARKRSVQNLSAHLRIASAIGANGLIFHIGSGKELPKERAIQHAVREIREVLAMVPGATPLIIENSAGGGKSLGSLPDDVGLIMQYLDSKRVKICVDTAHAYEAGLIDAYTPQKTNIFWDAWEKAVGMDTIVALHVNDSKTVFNSHHDRHENIGEGHIGIEGFRSLAAEPRIRNKDWILEVPGFTNEGPDRKNIEILKALFR